MPTAAFAQDASSVWTGGYLGLDLGAGMGSVSVTDNVKDGIPPGPYDYSTGNLLADLAAGYNLQAGVFVLGAEGRIGYLDPIGKGYIPSSHPGQHQDLVISPGVTAEVSGRVGLGLDHTLVYAKGGAVYFGGGSTQATTVPGYAPTAGGPFVGWTAGVGLEQMVTDHVGLRIEYAHTVYNTVTGYQAALFADPPTPAGYKFLDWTSFSTDTVTVGMNLHF